MADDASKNLPRDIPVRPEIPMRPEPEVVRLGDFASRLGDEARTALGESAREASERVATRVSVPPSVLRRIKEVEEVRSRAVLTAEAVGHVTRSNQALKSLADIMESSRSVKRIKPTMRPVGTRIEPLGPMVNQIARDQLRHVQATAEQTKAMAEGVRIIGDTMQQQSLVMAEGMSALTEKAQEMSVRMDQADRRQRVLLATAVLSPALTVPALIATLGGGLLVALGALVVGLIATLMLTWFCR